jgi:molybdate transport system substrate-binding protein
MERQMCNRVRVVNFIGLAACLTAAWPVTSVRAQQAITVFAAASMKNALDDINAVFTKATGIKTVASYAATPALVRQIEAGAPADIFISADLRWMDYAVKQKLVAKNTRINLLGNRLVLIAPKASKLAKVNIVNGFDLAKLAGKDRIAVANVDAVPAGRYAKAALTSLGIWPTVEHKLAQAQNVRVALAYVARGETPLGIVYETDAKVEPGVKVVGVFPESSHPPITYPVAATTKAKPLVKRYLDFLRGKDAKAIFESFGFSYLIHPTA